jgi:hypothetical protein
MMGLKVRTELSNCALKPKYIISFYGAARIQGANRVYEAKQDSFRVYVNSPDTANKKVFASNKYTVAWLCLPQVSGQSSTDWDDSIRDGKATKIVSHILFLLTFNNANHLLSFLACRSFQKALAHCAHVRDFL